MRILGHPDFLPPRRGVLLSDKPLSDKPLSDKPTGIMLKKANPHLADLNADAIGEKIAALRGGELRPDYLPQHKSGQIPVFVCRSKEGQWRYSWDGVRPWLGTWSLEATAATDSLTALKLFAELLCARHILQHADSAWLVMVGAQGVGGNDPRWETDGPTLALAICRVWLAWREEVGP